MDLVAALLAFWCVHLALPPTAARDVGAVLPRSVDGQPAPTGPPVGAPGLPPRVMAATCLLSGTVIGWAFGGTLGAVLGLPAGVFAAMAVARLEPRAVRAARDRLARDLPVAVDLLAACADVGTPPGQALRVVAAALGGPLAGRLQPLLLRLELGADPLTEWSRLCDDEALGPLARTMRRSLESGAPMADALARLAVDRRRERRTESQRRARSVGVRAAAPLALCFLPAFMLVGVVPTVVATFAELSL
jgi:pilus assembly protein TadC